MKEIKVCIITNMGANQLPRQQVYEKLKGMDIDVGIITGTSLSHIYIFNNHISMIGMGFQFCHDQFHKTGKSFMTILGIDEIKKEIAGRYQIVEVS